MDLDSLNLWTRELEPEEMAEFLTYIDTLRPRYLLRDAFRERKLRDGGRLMIMPDPSHQHEACYIKLKWG